MTLQSILSIFLSLSILAPATKAYAADSPAPQVEDFVYFVSVRVKPDAIAKFKELALPYAELTRQETGTIAYILHQSPDDPMEFGVYEHWRSNEARAAHLAEPHTVAFFAQATPLFEENYPMRKKLIELRHP